MASLSPWAPASAPVLAGGAAPLALGVLVSIPVLSTQGLMGALAIGSLSLLFVMVSREQWLGEHRTGAPSGALGSGLMALALGAAWISVATELPLLALAGGAVALGWLQARRTVVLILILSLFTAGFVLSDLRHLASAPPWTLLELHPAGLAVESVAAALLLSGASSGQWSTERKPGQAALPFATWGLGLSALLMTTWALAATHAHELTQVEPGFGLRTAQVFALGAGTVHYVGSGESSRRFPRVAVFVLALGLFWMAGAPGAKAWWGCIFPLGGAAVLLTRCRSWFPSIREAISGAPWTALAGLLLFGWGLGQTGAVAPQLSVTLPMATSVVLLYWIHAATSLRRENS